MSTQWDLLGGLLRKYGYLLWIAALPFAAGLMVLAESAAATSEFALAFRARTQWYIAFGAYYAISVLLLSVPLATWRSIARCWLRRRRRIAATTRRAEQLRIAAVAPAGVDASAPGPSRSEHLDGVDEIERRILRIFVDTGQPSFTEGMFNKLVERIANDSNFEERELQLAALRLRRRDYLVHTGPDGGPPKLMLRKHLFAKLSANPSLVGSTEPPRTMA